MDMASTANLQWVGIDLLRPVRPLDKGRVPSLTRWPGGHRLEIMRGKAPMRITLELPEEIVRELGAKWKDLPRAALESLAVEAYRSRALTAAQLRKLLGFETRMQVDAFLKEHEVYDFTAADFEQDRETLRRLRAREAQH